MLANGPWPPKPGEHLALRLVDKNTIQICEFVSDYHNDGKTLEVLLYDQYYLDVPNSLSLWQFSEKDRNLITKEEVLPVRPQIELVPSLSCSTRSGRKMVFQVENMDVSKATCS